MNNDVQSFIDGFELIKDNVPRTKTFDFIYNNLDELLINHKFGDVEKIINYFIDNLSHIQMPLLLGVFTITHVWKQYLPSRQQMLDKFTTTFADYRSEERGNVYTVHDLIQGF